jgi:hypothetical protein
MLITSLFTSPSKDSQARARSADEAYAMLKTNREDTDYLYHISKRKKYLYVETPKVASTTIKRSLHRAEVGCSKIKDNPHDNILWPLRSPFHSEALFLKALQGKNFRRFCFVRNPFTRILSCYVDKFRKNYHPAMERQLGLQNARYSDGARRKQPKLSFVEKNYHHALERQLDLKEALSSGGRTRSELSFLEFLRAISNPKILALNVHWMPQHLLLSSDVVDYDFMGKFESFGSDFARLGKIIGVEQRDDGRQHATHADQLINHFYGPEELKYVIRIYENDFRTFNYKTDLRYI